MPIPGYEHVLLPTTDETAYKVFDVPDGASRCRIPREEARRAHLHGRSHGGFVEFSRTSTNHQVWFLPLFRPRSH